MLKKEQLPATRWGAFSIHIGISIIIFLVLLALIMLWWYPGALTYAAGGIEGIKIVAGVDLVLGPALTLIIYNPTKPIAKLMRDLSIIAFIQLSCLTVGIYIIFNERPVAVVYAYDSFYTLKQDDLLNIGAPPELLMQYPGIGPKYLYVETPESIRDIEAMVISHTFMGVALHHRTDLYKEIPTNIDQLRVIFQFSTEGGVTTSNCIPAKIKTQYIEGGLCFNFDEKILLGFKPDW